MEASFIGSLMRCAQRVTSSLMFRMVISVERFSCLKTKAFLESQIFQSTEESAKGQLPLERQWCLLFVQRSVEAKDKAGNQSPFRPAVLSGR